MTDTADRRKALTQEILKLEALSNAKGGLYNVAIRDGDLDRAEELLEEHGDVCDALEEVKQDLKELDQPVATSMNQETGFTQRDLAMAQCSSPGCAHEEHDQLFLRGACCSAGEVVVSYKLTEGVLQLSCPQCDRPVARVAVAP